MVMTDVRFWFATSMAIILIGNIAQRKFQESKSSLKKLEWSTLLSTFKANPINVKLSYTL